MKRKSFLFLFTFFLTVPFVFSVPPENLLTPVTIARLNSSGNFIYETRFSNTSPVLIPSDNDLRKVIAEVSDSLSYNIMVETLYLHKKPEQSCTSSETWDNIQKTGLYNQLLAISTLEGIQYYSASRGTMRTFFEYSRVIDQPNARNPAPLSDPVFNTPPQSFSLYARQKDLTFGDNIYQYSFRTVRDGIFFIQENITSLTYGVIPAVGKGNLRSVFAVFDCGDTLLIYSASFVKSLSVSSLNERISVSFSNRAEAVIKWFADRADTVLSKTE